VVVAEVVLVDQILQVVPAVVRMAQQELLVLQKQLQEQLILAEVLAVVHNLVQVVVEMAALV
jgi:hypothetical protein